MSASTGAARGLQAHWRHATDRRMGGTSRWLLPLRSHGGAPSSSFAGDAGARTVGAERVWRTGEAAEIGHRVPHREAGGGALRVNIAAFYGDLHQLKSLILKTPTTMAASLWYEQNGSCQFNLSSAGSKLRSAQDSDVSISSFFPRINYSYQFDHVDIFFHHASLGTRSCWRQ